MSIFFILGFLTVTLGIAIPVGVVAFQTFLYRLSHPDWDPLFGYGGRKGHF